jgi:hypothetical protein
MAQHGSLGKMDLRQPTDPETGMKQLDVYQDALAHVQSRGLQMPSLPTNEYRGQMPQVLTSLDDDELGDLLNNLSQYCGYVENELSGAQTKLDTAKAQYEFLYSRIRVGVKASVEGKMTDRDRTDLVVTDPRIVEAQRNVLYAEATYRLTRNIRDQTQRNWDTVSRRITQRGQEVERMRRENNVAGVPAQGRTFRRPGM